MRHGVYFPNRPAQPGIKTQHISNTGSATRGLNIHVRLQEAASQFVQFTHASRQADLLYVQAGDVQVYDAPLQAVHHAAVVVVGQQVPHDGRGQVTQAVGHNVGLQRLQEDALSHCVLHQARVQLLKQQVPAGRE